jgi:hypothetical protein
MKHSIAIVGLALVLGGASCKKSDKGGGGNQPPPQTSATDSTYNPVDPANPVTVGFFANGWTQRSFSVPADNPASPAPPPAASDSLVIDVNNVVAKVPPTIFGNNSNLWMGQLVTQPSLMQYIKDLSPNIIRAPAGSVSDIYFFNGTDASPKPADAPDSILDNTGKTIALGPWYGGNNGTWTLALANYYTMLAQTNSTGIITVNYGYARYGTGASPVDSAAHLAANWVRYDNGRTKFWEIGNETYGNWEAGFRIDPAKNHDGQPAIVTGSLYGQHVKVFADSMRAAAKEKNATIYIGATLYSSQPQSFDNSTTQTWNTGVLGNVGTAADYFIVHDYFTAYNTNSSAADILATGTNEAPKVMNFIKGQLQGAGVNPKPIAMTEWNIQATGSKQSVSYVSGIHAALTLGSFIKNQYGEASRWDLGNGYANGDDMGMFNIGDEPGAPLWNPRPAFYYMYFFQKCFGDRMVADSLKAVNKDLTTWSSTFGSGQAGTVIINTGAVNHVVAIDFKHFPAGSKYHWYALTGGTDNAPFSGQVYVNGAGPSTPTGGPLNYSTIQPYGGTLSGTIKVAVPAMSVVYLVADKK